MARGDAGARGYLAAHDVVLVECGGVGDGRDVDGPDVVGPDVVGPDIVGPVVVAEVTARSEVEAVAVSHRLGELGVGDVAPVAPVAAVAAAHRQEAFAAAALLVDEVKHRLPVWKRQLFSDGTDEWVVCP
jgi:molybdopterin synthase catalytic subunit